MNILENHSLAEYTTFKIGGTARYFCFASDELELLEALNFAKIKNLKVLILGGGSNLLISEKGFYGLVIKMSNKGLEVKPQTDKTVILKAASGEIWDEVVNFAVNHNWWGIENLSHIPGSTGAIAIQNVGAYGQEASKVIQSILALDSKTQKIVSLNNSDCAFGYRKSIFNSSEKGRYIILSINFKLKTFPDPVLNYADLKNKFPNSTTNIFDIRKAVIEIRDKKFPFPTKAENGNAGSFFKNPLIDISNYEQLKLKILKNFGQQSAVKLEAKKISEGEKIKIPAAFLIDLCNLKNIQFGGALINKSQPLVILNKTGLATSTDILTLAEKVKETVYEKTGILLEYEPELIGF